MTPLDTSLENPRPEHGNTDSAPAKPLGNILNGILVRKRTDGRRDREGWHLSGAHKGRVTVQTRARLL